VWLSGDADGHASALSIPVRMRRGVPHLSHAVVHPIDGFAYTTQAQPWVVGNVPTDTELVLGVAGSGNAARYALAVCTVGRGCALRPTTVPLSHQQLEFVH
jgi:hypothetical protein